MKRALERRLAPFLHRRPTRLKAGIPCVSMTFDDVPMSACLSGAQIMERWEARATYYVAGKFDQGDSEGHFHTGDTLMNLSLRGHEVECHGFGHLHYQNTSNQKIIQDIDDNRAYFERIGLPPARTFAYPYGGVSPRIKRVCGRKYPICRGITPGVNRGVVDAHLLKAVPLYEKTWSLERSRNVLKQVQTEGGLLIFFTHGVEENPSTFDCSPSLLESTLKIARDLEVEILPLGEAICYLSDFHPQQM